MAGPDPADGHADQVATHVVGGPDEEHRRGVDDGGDDDEDLPTSDPVGQPAG